MRMTLCYSTIVEKKYPFWPTVRRAGNRCFVLGARLASEKSKTSYCISVQFNYRLLSWQRDNDDAPGSQFKRIEEIACTLKRANTRGRLKKALLVSPDKQSPASHSMHAAIWRARNWIRSLSHIFAVSTFAVIISSNGIESWETTHART